ncbi:hypothetical protein [Halobellus rubicundus]|uniref:Uncharacterized protein n=1 Tax=Halobellus rubicundus TaxID=2996466 RepID=A0ABD5MFJ7_9EURY
MSDSKFRFEPSRFTLCAFLRLDEPSEEELLEILEFIQSISEPSRFSNQIVDINEESVEESVILYAENIPRGPVSLEDVSNSIFIEVDEDTDVHIHIEGDADSTAQCQRFINSIIDEYGELTLSQLNFMLESDINIDKLNIPVDRDSKFKIDGVQLTYDSENYVISRRDEGDKTKISHSIVDDEIVTPDRTEFIAEKREKVQEFSNKLVDQ